MQKWYLVAALLTAAPIVAPRPAQAQSRITVLNNGQPINFGAVPPQMVDGRVLVPLRSVFEALGATVDYNAATRTVFAARGATTLELQIGSAQAVVNGRLQTLDVPAQVRLGSTLVPLRFVSQALGAQVNWNAATQTVYITSSAPAPVSAATPTPTPSPADNAPRIDLVRHDAPRPLKAGEKLTVTVRGTAGAAGSFDISPRITKIPLAETQQPGVYTGTYQVRRNDDVLESRITAHLKANGLETTLQSQQPLTIDTIAPRITYAQPRDIVVPVDKPNIVIYANDLNGSGLGTAEVKITSGGETFTAPATVAPEAVSALSPRALNGAVTVNATIADKAGNTVTDRFGFTVRPVGAITSVTHSATRPLQAGETVTVEMRAQPRGRASFDVLDAGNKLIAQAVPLSEIEEGRYQGTYLVPNRENGALQIVGRFVDPATGKAATAKATTPLQVLGGAPTAPTITQPAADQQVQSPLVVRGRAAPNTTVEVSIRATGTQLFVFRYDQELGTQQVKSDANGNWTTAPIELPQPNGVRNLRFIITAAQIDAANRRSEETTVAVHP